MKSKVIVLFMCAITLSGCAETYEQEDVSGVVVSKEHDKAGYTSSQY